MTAAPLPDASAGNWVDRFAPEGLRPWLKLGRFDRPVGAWLLLLPGWQGVALACSEKGRWPDLMLLLAIFVGAFVMRGAGCAFNDLVDRDVDAKVARTAGRPVASGQITPKQALGYSVGLSIVGLCILLTMNWTAIALGVASVLLVAAYPFMKRVTWWPQAWLGLTFNWPALVGYAAVSGRVDWPAVLLWLSGVFWTLGYDTIYALQDREDDALAGAKSSARALGGRTQPAVLGFYIACFVLALAAAATAGLGALFLPLAGLYALHLSRQAAAIRLDDPAGALKLFKSNQLAGLILFAAFVAGVWRPYGDLSLLG
jgi:4-hydroxybenzoate polyprenyltransferase